MRHEGNAGLAGLPTEVLTYFLENWVLFTSLHKLLYVNKALSAAAKRAMMSTEEIYITNTCRSLPECFYNDEERLGSKFTAASLGDGRVNAELASPNALVRCLQIYCGATLRTLTIEKCPEFGKTIVFLRGWRPKSCVARID